MARSKQTTSLNELEELKKELAGDILFQSFCKEYDSNKPSFLLYEIANANENAHTNLLARLLEYNNHQFLESFLKEVLNYFKDVNNEVEISTQKQAVGLESVGFIDLYITNGDDKIILENKIKGAGDTGRQLARYIATALKGWQNKKEYNAEFDKWYRERIYLKEQYNNIYVYYLTRNDGDEGPSNDEKVGSLPDDLKDALGEHYNQISYQTNVLTWLKESVMPKIPYEQDGMMISALRQYIAYIEYYTKTQEWQRKWSEGKDSDYEGMADIDKYNRITEKIDKYSKLEKEDTNDCLRQFINTLEYKREEIFRHDLDNVDGYEDWRIHYTPSFIILYKQSWADADERKYSIPSVYIGISPAWHSITEKKRSISYNLNIDHLTINKNNANVPQNINELEKRICHTSKFQDRLLNMVMSGDNAKYFADQWGNHNKQYKLTIETPYDIGENNNLNDRKIRAGILQEISRLNELINQIDYAINSIQKKN